ncbi:hypothetical protein KP509_16G061900 [Ceratopteris richardii]|uniref:Two-component response regulator-like APRR2 n=1 Tax=Ceratopteris richardii TaxID=49495 RepID=A0A8T2T2Y7_CERRI|nr:hypothetical protein KP509_16G061900 [Ceratopteris richardii]
MEMSAENQIPVPAAFLEKFPAWKNFPVGLHILALDEDENSLQHSRSLLEACFYTVTPFSDRRSASEALRRRSRDFHLTLVEANVGNAADVFNIIRDNSHIPTVLLSASKDVTLMMEGIAAGATEFLEKPLSEDKAKNLWQHVFRKSLAMGEVVAPEQQKDLKSFDIVKAVQDDCSAGKCFVKEEPLDESSPFEDLMSIGDSSGRTFFEDIHRGHVDDKEAGSLQDMEHGNHKETLKQFVGSSSLHCPQLEQTETRPISQPDNAVLQSQDFTIVTANLEDLNSSDCTSFVHAKDEDSRIFQSNSGDDEFQSLHDFECLDAALNKYEEMQSCTPLDLQDDIAFAGELVDELSSCLDMDSSILDELPSVDSLEINLSYLGDNDQCDEEALLLAEVAEAEAGMTSNSCDNYMPVTSCSEMSPSEGKSSPNQSGRASRSMHSSKKKMKVDWTPELHRRFVQAVEQLGVDKAIPSRILEIMGVENLTRHNIASHLQKYRSHKKHNQVRDAESVSWNQRKNMETGRQPLPPSVISKPVAPFFPIGLHVWGHPTPEQYWPKPWQSLDSSVWHQSHPVYLDTWGHPVGGGAFFQTSHCPAPVLQRLPLAPIPGVINQAAPLQNLTEKNMHGIHMQKDKVDAAINEVLKDPFMPLPLGLKPPSLESVLGELQRQGIRTIPPTPS